MKLLRPLPPICVLFQGSRVLKNFNIRKEAGWVTSQAVLRNFKARVLENYLEIHLLWVGKGTSSIPVQGTYGPSIAAISVSASKKYGIWNFRLLFCQLKSSLPFPVTNDYWAFDADFEPTGNNESPASKKNKTGVVVGVVVGAGVLGFLTFLMIRFVVQRRKKPHTNDDEGQRLLELCQLHVDGSFSTLKFMPSVGSNQRSKQSWHNNFFHLISRTLRYRC